MTPGQLQHVETILEEICEIVERADKVTDSDPEMSLQMAMGIYQFALHQDHLAHLSNIERSLERIADALEAK